MSHTIPKLSLLALAGAGLVACASTPGEPPASHPYRAAPIADHIGTSAPGILYIIIITPLLPRHVQYSRSLY